MDHPVKDIRSLTKKFAFGLPEDQRDAFNNYFLPASSFVHPLIRVPSFTDVQVPYLGTVNSRYVTRLLYRLRAMLLSVSDFNIESAVYDQKTATLTAHISEKLHPKFIPFHSPTVHSTLIFRLSQRTLDSDGNVLPPCDPESPDAQGGRTRLFISEHEKVMQPTEVLKIAIPLIGSAVWSSVQFFITLWLLLLASVFVPIARLMPETVIKNGDPVVIRKTK